MVVSDLNEGENSFRWLAENLPGIVYRVLIEDDNQTMFFNDMVQTMTGYSSKDLKKGKICSIDPLILPEDRINVLNIIKDAIENNVPFEVEYRINTKSGEVKWFFERGRPIKGDNGNPSYIEGVIFDITNRKEATIKLEGGKIGLRESEQKFKSVFDDSPIGIELYDSNGKLVDMNKSCLDIFGVSHVTEVADFDLFKDPNVPKEQLKKLKKGQTIRLEILFDFELVKDLNLYETSKSGKIWIDVLISPLYLKKNKKISNYLVQLQDITEQKIAEEKLKTLNEELDNRVHERTKELKESEEKYRLITENVDGLISVSDQNMNFEYINEKAYFNILGRSKEEIIGKSPLSWVHPEDAEKLIEMFKIGFEEGEGSLEVRIRDKKGVYHWLDIKGKAFIDHDGKKKVLTISRDTTHHKQAEQIIIQEREKANLYLNVVEVILVALDKDGNITLINKKGHELLGYDEGELIGKKWFEVCLPPHDSERVHEYFKKLMVGEIELIKFYENPIWTKKREERLISWSSVLFKDENGDVTGLLASGVDITERAIIEQKLIESELKYKSLASELEIILDHLPGIVVYKDTENNILRVNKFLADAHNLKKAEMENRSSFELYPRDFAQAYWEDDLEVINSKKPKMNIVEPWETDAGRRWVNTSKMPYIDANGNVKGIIAIAFDITERMLAEQKLIREKEKAQNYLDIAGVILLVLNTDQTVQLINRKGCEILGEDESELIGINWIDKYIPEENRTLVKKEFNRFVNGEIELFEYTEESLIIKNGEKRIIAWHNIALKNEAGQIIGSLSSGEDITERKKAEKKLEESEEKFRKQNVFLNNLLESLTHPFYVIDVKDYKIKLANSAASIEGVEDGNYCYNRTHNTNKPCEAPCVCPLDEVKKTKKTCLVQHRRMDKEGNEKIFDVYGYPILDENGNVVQMIEYALDVTDRKIVQQELKESEEKYRHLFDNSPYYIILLDKEGNYIDCNKATIDIYGYPKEDFFGKNFKEMPIIPLELVPTLENRMESLFKGEILPPVEFKPIRKDGKIIWINSQASLIKLGNEFFIYIIGQDITERKKAELKIKESEENYRHLANQWRTTFDAMNEAVFLLDVEQNILQCNKASLDILGKEKYKEIIGHSCCEIVHGTIEPVEWCPMVRMIESCHEESSIAQIGDRWCEISVDPVINDEGTLIGAVHIITDITERRKTEAALLGSEEKFRNIIEQSVDGFLMVNENGIIIEWNKGQEQIIGLKREDVLGKPLWDIQSQTDPEQNKSLEQYERIKEMLKDAFKTGDAQWLGKLRDINIRRVDNKEIRTIQQLPFLIKTENKIMLGNFSRDITEQKRIQKEIQEKQATLESIFRAAPIGIGVVKNRVLNQVNDRFCNIVGYTRGELLNKSARIVYPSDEEYEFVGKVKYDQINKSGIGTVETKFLRKDGKIIDALLSSVPMDLNDHSVGVTFTALDITERKKVEQELIESEQKFRTIAEQSFMGIVIIQDGLFKYFNQRTVDINGYSVEEIQNWKPYEFAKVFHSEDRDFVMDQARKKQDGQIDVVNHYKYRVIKKSGEIVWIDNYSKTITYNGRFADFVMSEDITDKIMAEQKLKESEEKFRTIAERTYMGILIMQDNQVKYANEALLNLFEYAQEEILNWTEDDLTNLIHPEDLSFLKEYRMHLRDGDTGLKPYYSYRVFTKLGKIKWIDQFSKKIQYKGGPAELVTIIDITEKKEVEQELIKLNNMKSELLRRTSHELKTPLVSIKGFSDLLLELHRDKLDKYVIRTIEQIRSGCYRLESLVADILKTSELDSGTVGLKKLKEDLSLLIKICVSDLEGLTKLRNHTINLEILDDLICSFEKKQIYNVITNILSNAIKYTPISGKIEVKSEITNGFIIISIHDNGIGFSKEEKDQIFKKFGKIERYGQGYDIISEGSGLGLYISKKIIEMHGGEVWLESEGRDRGSTFYFSLPVV